MADEVFRFLYLCCRRPVFTITNVSSGKTVFGVECQDGASVHRFRVGRPPCMADRGTSVLESGAVSGRLLNTKKTAQTDGSQAPEAQSNRGRSHPESAHAFLPE